MTVSLHDGPAPSPAGGSSLPPDAAAALVVRMRREGLSARPDPIEPASYLLVRPTPRGSLGAGRVKAGIIHAALAAGSLHGDSFGNVTVPDSAVALDSRSVVVPRATPQPSPGQTSAPCINAAESPLLWLHRRKGPDGRPLLDETCVLAGERFRRDVTQAAMLPNVTTNWSRMDKAAGRTTPRDPALASDVVIAARQRVRAAYRLLGSEMGNYLLDVCGFLVPLQEAEQRRSWPSRSGKLVLRIALLRLAEHYGLAHEASGRSVGQTRSWQAHDARPDMADWLSGP